MEILIFIITILHKNILEEIYQEFIFFDKFPNEKKRLPTCFEDCTVEKQEEILNSKDLEWVKSLALLLSKKLKEIGKQFDIVSENS